MEGWSFFSRDRQPPRTNTQMGRQHQDETKIESPASRFQSVDHVLRLLKLRRLALPNQIAECCQFTCVLIKKFELATLLSSKLPAKIAQLAWCLRGIACQNFAICQLFSYKTCFVICHLFSYTRTAGTNSRHSIPLNP